MNGSMQFGDFGDGPRNVSSGRDRYRLVAAMRFAGERWLNRIQFIDMGRRRTRYNWYQQVHNMYTCASKCTIIYISFFFFIYIYIYICIVGRGTAWQSFFFSFWDLRVEPKRLQFIKLWSRFPKLPTNLKTCKQLQVVYKLSQNSSRSPKGRSRIEF